MHVHNIFSYPISSLSIVFVSHTMYLKEFIIYCRTCSKLEIYIYLLNLVVDDFQLVTVHIMVLIAPLGARVLRIIQQTVMTSLDSVNAGQHGMEQTVT